MSFHWLCFYASSAHIGELDDDDGVPCRPDNQTTVICSGRGACVCGICECERRISPGEIIYGKYCECDDFSCDRHNGLICGGHGSCRCGYCVCEPGWTGSDCACATSTENCIPRDRPSDGICSGHGECECGACRCQVTEDGRYSGRFCESCPTCAGQCHELKNCVQCQVYKTGPLANAEDCARNCMTLVPISVDNVEANEEKNERICTFYDEDNCRFQFAYGYNGYNDVVHVAAQHKRDCPRTVFSVLGDLYEKLTSASSKQ